MNYFNELLESYSLLKQRKLKLLEQEAPVANSSSGNQIQGSNPQERVRDIIAKTKSQAGTVKESNPLLLYLGDKEFKCWVARNTRQVSVKYGFSNYNAEKNPNALYKHLVTAEDEEQKSSDQQQQPQEDQSQSEPMAGESQAPEVTSPLQQIPIPGAGIQKSELATTSPESAAAMQEVFRDIAARTQSIFSSLSKNLKQFYKSSTVVAQRLYGDHKSLESIISNAVVIKRDDRGELVSIKASGDSYLSLAVSRSVDKIIDITTKNSITDSDKIKLDSLVAYTKDEELIIFDEGGSEGLLFQTRGKVKGGIVGAMLTSFEEKFNHKIKTADPRNLSLTKENNAIQSTFFEDVAGILALGSVCKEERDDPTKNVMKAKKYKKGDTQRKKVKDQSSCAKMIEHLTHRYADKAQNLLKILSPMALLERSNEDYALALKSGDNTVPFLKNLIRRGTDKMYQAIIRVSKHALETRKAERSISKGLETMNGKRADATEVWSTREQLTKALINSGVTPEEIEKHKFIKEVTIEEAYGSQPSNMELRKMDTVYKPGQKVFILDVSYKNYLNLKFKAVAGSNLLTTRENFLNGKHTPATTFDEFGNRVDDPQREPENIEADRRFREAMSKNLFGEGSRDLEVGSPLLAKLSKYHNEELKQKIFDIIKDTPLNAQTQSSDGKKIKKVKPFEMLAKSIIEQLSEDKSYAELFGRDPIDEFELANYAERGEYSQKRQKQMDEDARELYNYLRTFVKKKPGESNKEALTRAKGSLAMYLMNRKIKKDLASDDPEVRQQAKEYLAVKFFLAGGSNDDSLICDWRELYGKDNFIFRQNEAFSMVREWLHGGDEANQYQMISTGNTFILRKKDDHDIYISCNDARFEGSNDEENGIQSSITVTSFSNKLLRLLDKRKNRIVSSVESNNTGELLMEFLEGQKNILTKLFEIISKGV